MQQFCFWCAISSGKERSWVLHCTAPTFDECWQQLQRQSESLIEKKQLPVKYLRIDWVTATQQLSMAELNQLLRDTKRNYFRYGLAFDEALQQIYTEQELNANALLYAGNTVRHCQLNPGNFAVYQQRRFGQDLPNPAKLPTTAPVWLLKTQGLFLDPDHQLHLLYPSGPDSSRRQLPTLKPAALSTIIGQSSRYLAAMVQPEGRYHYGYFPCFDRAIGTYNTLRHASSTYALLEAYEFNPSAAVLTAIELALQAMTQSMLTYQTTDTGEKRAFLYDEGQEIKLGGNALCLLALCKYTTLTAKESYLPLMQQLATGILSMQDQQSGRFVHVLHSDDFRVKEHFRIIYYDGEACFALLRYFALCQDEKWLNAAALAFDDFIARKHWAMHDHWLSYSVNELVKYRPAEKYFQFGLQNVMGHLDFVIERITTFPTLLELMMAAQQLLARLIQHPDYYHLYHSLNLSKFYFAMHRRAQHMLNGFFWPELAMFYRFPDKIAGSFFIRHHAFRIRIDDLEHYLSGYIAYAVFLQQETPELTIPAPPIALPATHWSAATLALATGGRWLEQPEEPLEITSVAISPHGLQDKALVMLAKTPTSAGFKQSQLPKYQGQIVAALTDSTLEERPALPLLLVPDNQQAVLDLGSFARSQMTGRIIAVTGSAGKSTMVAMLHHCLAAFGRTASNRANANLPLGVAWNLASMPLEADFIALELAIGSIRLSSRIARPHIAIITTIAPAHLEYHKDVDTIARKKSRIFHEMAPGSLAIINRDIPQWALIAAEAKNRALHIISFGRHPAADVRLLKSNQTGIHVIAGSRKLHFQLGSPGQHQAMNALAAIAVASFLKLPLEQFCQNFVSFQAIAGRGNLQQLKLTQGNIQMMDDAYNANPASMQALLQTLTELKREGRLLLVLGDMLELGEDTTKHHQALLPDLIACRPDKVFFVGPEMTALKPLVAEGISVSCWQDLTSLQQALQAELREQDLLVLKASHGIGLHKIVERLQREQLKLRF